MVAHEPAPVLALADVEAFLRGYHGSAVTGLMPLVGGFWSSAFAYDVDGQALVARFGSVRGGFIADRDAMAFSSDDLPVPAVLDIGDAFGRSFAISVRAEGRFLESVAPDEADVVAPTVLRLLGALKAVPAVPRAAGTWREWLLATTADGPPGVLAPFPEAARVHAACQQRIRELVDAAPERGDLVHSDLLHQNVLISGDGSRVNAVFSWKCSERGDFLYDTAWLSFWGAAAFPAVAALNAVDGVCTANWVDAAALEDAAVRHYLYELHVGARHFGWTANVGDIDTLRAVTATTSELLERGPNFHVQQSV